LREIEWDRVKQKSDISKERIKQIKKGARMAILAVVHPWASKGYKDSNNSFSNTRKSQREIHVVFVTRAFSFTKVILR